MTMTTATTSPRWTTEAQRLADTINVIGNKPKVMGHMGRIAVIGGYTNELVEKMQRHLIARIDGTLLGQASAGGRWAMIFDIPGDDAVTDTRFDVVDCAAMAVGIQSDDPVAYDQDLANQLVTSKRTRRELWEIIAAG
jgi:hypothetical protein